MKSKAAFNHLLRHYRSHKIDLPYRLASADKAVNVAIALGALDCLYWQALGNGLTNFAKGIHRTIVYSYRYHTVRLPSHPSTTCHSKIKGTIETRPDNSHPGTQIDIEDIIRGAA